MRNGDPLALAATELMRIGRINFLCMIEADLMKQLHDLLPALFCVILATVAFTATWQPDQLASLRGDLLPAIAYVANWHQVFEQRPYFETIGQPPLLQHLWSLAVEEQFYLAWPLVLMIGLRFVSRAWLSVGLGLAALGSALWMAYLTQTPGDDPLRALDHLDDDERRIRRGLVRLGLSPCGFVRCRLSPCRRAVAGEAIGREPPQPQGEIAP